MHRKLTEAEATQLQEALRDILVGKTDDADFTKDTIEYCLSMVSNQKSIHHVVEELTGMELDFLNQKTMEALAGAIHSLLTSLGATAPTAKSDDSAPEESAQKAKLTSLKSSKQNALTMSGALGASRERGSKQQQQQQQQSKQQPQSKQ